jgi:hypothetical protein
MVGRSAAAAAGGGGFRRRRINSRRPASPRESARSLQPSSKPWPKLLERMLVPRENARHYIMDIEKCEYA